MTTRTLASVETALDAGPALVAGPAIPVPVADGAPCLDGLPGPAPDQGERDDAAVRAMVLAARDGDEAAFVCVYRRYAEPVYRYCLARVRDPADAEDLMQQTFLRVVEALPAWQDRGLPFGAWLFRIARNVSIDAHRRRRVDLVAGEPGDGVEIAAAAPRVAAEERDELLEAMGLLTADQRQVLQLRFFADLSTREVGHILGRDEVAVRALQKRAIAALRRAMVPQAQAWPSQLVVT